MRQVEDRRLASDQATPELGQTMVEYALLLTLSSMAAVALLLTIGPAIAGFLASYSSAP